MGRIRSARGGWGASRPRSCGRQGYRFFSAERADVLRTVSAKLELSDRKADHFTHVEGKDRFALVLIDLGREAGIIAVPSFDREADTDRTEYAAAGRGLTLTRRLIEAAIKSGARTFTRIVLPGNVRMLNLLRDLALPEPLRYEDGIEFVEIDLLPKRS